MNGDIFKPMYTTLWVLLLSIPATVIGYYVIFKWIASHIAIH